MAALAGIGASVTEASTAFTDASKWTINIATVKSWTAKVSAFLDTADTAQTNLLAGLNNSFSLTLQIVNTPHSFAGTGILTGIDPNIDAQGVETVDYSFTGSGAITYS